MVNISLFSKWQHEHASLIIQNPYLESVKMFDFLSVFIAKPSVMQLVQPSGPTPSRALVFMTSSRLTVAYPAFRVPIATKLLLSVNH